MKVVFFSLLAAAVLLLGFSGCGGSDPYDGESLEGTEWSLSSGVRTPLDIVLTLGFNRGRTGGWSGCNSFSVEYETGGDSLTLGREVMSTTASCAGTPGGTAEETYRPLFFDVDGWRIHGGELVLTSDGHDVLRYTPRGPEALDLVERLGSASE